jgi:hypothetical protein
MRFNDFHCLHDERKRINEGNRMKEIRRNRRHQYKEKMYL